MGRLGAMAPFFCGGIMNKDIKDTSEEIIKQGRRGLLSLVFSRFAVILLLMLIQIIVVVYGNWVLIEKYPILYILFNLFTALVVIALINVDMEPGAKLTWFGAIAVLPLFGTILYVYTRYNILNIRNRMRFERMERATLGLLSRDEEAFEHYGEYDLSIRSLADYLYRVGEFSVYEHTKSEYFPSGMAQYERMLVDLKEAKSFIFIESFIIEEGKMWGEIVEILREKATEGLEVRVLYDGTCSFFKLPHDYPKELEKYGIKCRIFSDIVPLFSTHYNYRDHRKIVVIDNNIAFTGGSNFADEYINLKERFGHWKEAGLRFEGDAVKSYTLAFLEMWEMESEFNKESMVRFKKEVKQFINQGSKGKKEDEFVIPFTDSPLDNHRVGENVFLHLFYNAKDYIHICTPYLILDYEMESALRFAAQRGVDVRIVLPGIPDKKIAFAVAYTHYENLLKSGVRIYEYSPGFIHQKTAVVDGREGLLGTINLDYRSLYHHFENAVLLSGDINHMEDDFNEIIKVSCEIELDSIKKQVKLSRRVLGRLVKILAPLM